MTESDRRPPSMKEEMDRLGISEETMDSMKRFFMKTSVPRLLEKRRLEQEEMNAKENESSKEGENMHEQSSD